MIIEWLKRLGLRRRYDPHSFLTKLYFRDRELLSWFDKKAIPLIVEKNLSMTINKLYALQNVMPSIHRETFSQFENKFENQEVVLMASGPTLANYTPNKHFKNAIHIGVNKLVTFDVELDYYFMADWTAIQNYGIENEVLESKAEKFFGVGVLSDECGVTSFTTPLDFFAKCKARPFFTLDYASHQMIQKDISRHPLFGWGSIIIPAFHFALYGHPKRIYLVGCDCSSGGHFDSQTWTMCDIATQRLIEEYRRMSLFAKYYYPDVEIISVNPVGLKGIFKDMVL